MKVAFFGDSHINLLKAADANLTIDQYVVREHSFTLNDDELRVRFFSSASATGLGNPNSTTGVSSEVPVFISRDKAEGVSDFVFHFGKVDLDFVLPYRMLKAKGLIDSGAFIKKAASSMINYLSDLKRNHLADERIHVLGITAPPLHTEAMVAFVKRESIMEEVEQKAGGRRDLGYEPTDQQIADAVGSRAHRTELCKQYNEHLFALADAQGFNFVDLFAATTDGATGELADIYNPHVDHHAIREPMAKTIYSAVMRAIK